MAPSPMLRAGGPGLDFSRGVARPAQIPETWTVPGQGNSPGGPAIFCYVTVSGFTGTPDQTGTVDQAASPSRGGTIDQTVPHGRTGTPQRADAPRPAVRGGRARLRYRPAWSLIAGPAVTLAMMLWGLAAPAYWGDEADTVSAVSRSLPQLLRMLRHVDAVHGLYYLTLWPVARVLGTDEFATRLPSALAMAAAAVGIAAIARRLASARAALWAGLLFAAFPMISAQGHDARPYGMVAASAVLASYLLIRAVADPRRRWFAGYGVSLVLLCYLELFGLLLILAHAITLAGLCRGGGHGSGAAPPRLVIRRWLITVVAALVAATPLGLYGWQQRAQIAWIARPDWHDVLSAATSLAGGPTALAVVVGVLAVLGAVAGPPAGPGLARAAGLPRRPVLTGLGRLTGQAPGSAGVGRTLTWLALPWLALPPAMLLAASEIKPVYNFRYLVFCLPAVALLAGAGLAALTPGRTATRPGSSRALRWAGLAGALAIIVALVAPTQLSIRVPGTGMRAVSQFLAARERPGDAVIYPGSGVPPWYLAYPDGLGRLRDIWMAESGPASARLYGVRVSLPVLEQREHGICRIWAAEMAPPWINPAQYLEPGFLLAGAWQPQPGVQLSLYQRPGCAPAPGAGR
jgi:mannosyltransferase